MFKFLSQKNKLGRKMEGLLLISVYPLLRCKSGFSFIKTQVNENDYDIIRDILSDDIFYGDTFRVVVKLVRDTNTIGEIVPHSASMKSGLDKDVLLEACNLDRTKLLGEIKHFILQEDLQPWESFPEDEDSELSSD